MSVLSQVAYFCKDPWDCETGVRVTLGSSSFGIHQLLLLPDNFNWNRQEHQSGRQMVEYWNKEFMFRE